MHFAGPPRKTPYTAGKPHTIPFFRRVRLRTVLWIIGVVFVLYMLFSWLRGGNPSATAEIIPEGTPPVVLVTTFDTVFGSRYEKMIKDNREAYAARHGYATFFAKTSDYTLNTDPDSDESHQVPQSWSKVPAMRHAMSAFPHSTYFFFLSQHSIIMRPDLSVLEHITTPSRLQDIMILDQPVVPPDSVIKTFKNTRASHVDLILTQDHDGLDQGSFIVRRSEWAKFFLDAWFDPLYRSYNFQRAEGHALEHLVQWHGTVLVKMALIPQRIMNSYNRGASEVESYAEGDFLVQFKDCDKIGSGRACETEAKPFAEKAVKAFNAV